MLGVIALAAACAVSLSAQGARPTAEQTGGARQGAAGGGRQGGGGRGAAPEPGGYGTSNTLYTMPEAGQGGGAGDPTPDQFALSAEAQSIVANAKKIAGADLTNEVSRFCTWNAGATVAPVNGGDFVQVFDNVYYAGTGSVGAWVIKTSAGLILWDTLDSEENARNILEAGMKNVGLNPADIKYLVIGHHHFDHVGGLEYFQRNYNPTILMGKLDWDVVMTSGTKVRRGVDVLDGQKVTLGDTTITLFLLPGHTPTSVSGIFPATYQGRTFNILNLTASRFSTYASLAAFQRIFDEAKRAKVEAVVQVHPDINMLKTETIAALRNYPVAGPHPMLFTPEKAARYMDVELECGRARVAANRAALDQARGADYYRTPAPPAAASGRGGNGGLQ
ncbi:MAG: MBL fold metallo-hydrolase [Acidobacteriota bacterium]